MPFCSDENKIEIVRGTTNSFGITIRNQDGSLHTLETGQVLVFGLKENELDEHRVLTKKITHTVNGDCYLELSPEDTKDLRPGHYYYDIGLQHGDYIFYNVIEVSSFIIRPNITMLGDGA